MTLVLVSAPALSRPISGSAVGATTLESGLPAVLPKFLCASPPDPDTITSRSDFRICSQALCLSFNDNDNYKIRKVRASIKRSVCSVSGAPGRKRKNVYQKLTKVRLRVRRCDERRAYRRKSSFSLRRKSPSPHQLQHRSSL